MSLDNAIEMLKAEYEKAKTIDFVKNPLAYALYHVWKAADKRGVKKSESL